VKCELEGKGTKASEEMMRRHKRMTSADGMKILRPQMIPKTPRLGAGKS